MVDQPCPSVRSVPAAGPGRQLQGVIETEFWARLPRFAFFLFTGGSDGELRS
jgi:hypothetical protein